MNDFTPVKRLNHVALKVRDLDQSVDFYTAYSGSPRTWNASAATPIAFLRASGSTNHHDLALLKIGPNAADASPRAVGLFHTAWEVDGIGDLAAARERLVTEGCFDSQADHGATRSVYGSDPDGNTFEIMWTLPREDWGSWATDAPIKAAMDLDAELVRWG